MNSKMIKQFSLALSLAVPMAQARAAEKAKKKENRSYARTNPALKIGVGIGAVALMGVVWLFKNKRRPHSFDVMYPNSPKNAPQWLKVAVEDLASQWDSLGEEKKLTYENRENFIEQKMDKGLQTRVPGGKDKNLAILLRSWSTLASDSDED